MKSFVREKVSTKVVADHFTEFGSSNVDPLWKLIETQYRIDRTDVASERLVDIFEAIILRDQVQ